MQRNFGKQYSRAAVVAACIVVAPAGASAAPATPAEAQRLQGVFETYLGKGGAGAPSPVAVTPAGEDYRLAIDFAAIAKPLAAFGFSLQVAPYTMMLTPQSDGLWRVMQNGMPDFQVRIKDQEMKMRFEGLRFEGLFDPKLAGFVRGRTVHGASILESAAPGMINTRRDGASSVELTGTGSGDGALSAIARSRTQSHQQSFRFGKEAGITEIAISTGEIASDITIDAFRNREFLDLWAFLVANPTAEALALKLEDVKARLRTSFPMFNVIAQTSSVKAISVTSPVGAFGMRDLGMAFNMTGIRKQGEFGLRAAIGGLSVPAAILPQWSVDLVPRDIVLDLKAIGYDLEAAANEFMNAVRADATPEESRAGGERAVYAIVPDGKVKISLGPSRLESKLLTLTLEGDLTVIQPIPRGRLVARAKGMDAAIGHLQAAAGSDPSVQQVLMGLIAAKGFGKAEPDGSLVWVIENPDGGLPTINGVAIPGMGGK